VEGGRARSDKSTREGLRQRARSGIKRLLGQGGWGSVGERIRLGPRKGLTGRNGWDFKPNLRPGRRERIEGQEGWV
jgi:hypothetical protein